VATKLHDLQQIRIRCGTGRSQSGANDADASGLPFSRKADFIIETEIVLHGALSARERGKYD